MIIEDKELTKYAVLLVIDDFRDLKIGEEFCVQTDAITYKFLGKIIDIQEYEYRKKKCFKVITGDKDYIIRVLTSMNS